MHFWDNFSSHHQGLEVNLALEFRSIGPLGSKLGLFKEGNHNIGPNIEAFLKLFVNPLLNSGLK